MSWCSQCRREHLNATKHINSSRPSIKSAACVNAPTMNDWRPGKSHANFNAPVKRACRPRVASRVASPMAEAGAEAVVAAGLSTVLFSRAQSQHGEVACSQTVGSFSRLVAGAALSSCTPNTRLAAALSLALWRSFAFLSRAPNSGVFASGSVVCWLVPNAITIIRAQCLLLSTSRRPTHSANGASSHATGARSSRPPHRLYLPLPAFARLAGRRERDNFHR